MTNSTLIYAMPNSTYVDGTLGMFKYVNDISDGLFFPLILFAIFAIIFITSLYATSAGRSLTFASFISMVLGMILSVLGFLAPKYMYLTIILLAIGILWIKLEDRE